MAKTERKAGARATTAEATPGRFRGDEAPADPAGDPTIRTYADAARVLRESHWGLVRAGAVLNVPRPPGRPATHLGDVQVSQIVRLISLGAGRITACDQVGVGYKVFLRHMRDDEAFAREIREAEAYRAERCQERIYTLATGGMVPHQVALRAAVAYLGRMDKLDASRRARKAQAAEAARPIAGADADPRG